LNKRILAGLFSTYIHLTALNRKCMDHSIRPILQAAMVAVNSRSSVEVWSTLFMEKKAKCLLAD